MSLVDTCKKNEENLKENSLSVSQYYHIRGKFLGVIDLFFFKRMTDLVFSTAISLTIVFLESCLFLRPGREA